MTIWFKRSVGMDSETMRQIATDAKVSWDTEPIVYRGRGIGYADGSIDDVTAIQDAAESVLGYRPVEIDPPVQQTDL